MRCCSPSAPGAASAARCPTRSDDLIAGTLIRLLPEWELPPLPVQLVVPSARHLSAKARSFLDHAARWLATLAVIRPER
jgi:DNA-binding transcriptional LysR family regulator